MNAPVKKICNKKHRYLPDFNDLPDGQDNQKDGRHVCAGCAYIEGIKDSLNGRKQRDSLENLPISQAGTVRHKDAWIGYKKGYNLGEKFKR